MPYLTKRISYSNSFTSKTPKNLSYDPKKMFTSSKVDIFVIKVDKSWYRGLISKTNVRFVFSDPENP